MRVPEARTDDLGIATQQQREEDVPRSSSCKGLFYTERHGWDALDDHRFDPFPIGEGQEMITGYISEVKKPEVPRK